MFFKSGDLDHSIDGRPASRLGHLLHPKPELDVLPSCHVRKKAVFLKNHAKAAFFRRQLADVLAVEANCAAVGLLEASEDS
jgi:hypothetical protein